MGLCLVALMKIKINNFEMRSCVNQTRDQSIPGYCRGFQNFNTLRPNPFSSIEYESNVTRNELRLVKHPKSSLNSTHSTNKMF